MSNRSTNFYVITGGPGVGKTALITELERLGYLTVAEDARRIIRTQAKQGGVGLPWKNKALYAHLMLDASIRRFQKALKGNRRAVHFFDRGVLDAVCYMRMEGIVITNEVSAQIAKYRYANKVFILPPWLEIYQNDDERKQSWEEASNTFIKMKETYQEFGYELIELPKASVSQRVEMICKYIAQ